MALSIIDSFGSSTANAYNSVTEVTSYMATKLDADAWHDLTTAQKEAAIMMASRDIDAKSWRGHRFFYNQLMQFPRTLATSLVDPGRTIISTPSLFDIEYQRQERQVRAACAEQCLKIAREKGRDYNAEAIVAGISSKSETVGGWTESISYRMSHLGLTKEALGMLREWKTPARLVRA